MQTIEHRNHTIEIHPDPDAQYPSFDGIEILYCSTSYPLGTRRASRDELDKISKRKYHMIPVYAYVHSDATISSSPFSCPFDSGQSGIAIMPKKDCRVTDPLKALENYVNAYGEFMMTGGFGYVIKDAEGNHVDSCWGYVTEEFCIDDAKNCVENLIYS